MGVAGAFDKEDREPEHQLVLGGVVTFDELLAARPRPDEAWDGRRGDPLRSLRPSPVGRPARPRGDQRPVSTPTTPRSPPFDVCGPLPTGVTVLEASAGTGKTYTIAALAARYVAEGIPLDQLLLVTFTRMATGELRERVRDRLVSAEQALSRRAGVPVRRRGRRAARSGRARRGRAAARAPHAGRRRTSTPRRSRRRTASARRCSAGLGVAGDVERDVDLRRGPRDLVEEVVDDLYVRRFHRRDGAADFDRAEALRIAQAAVDNPVARPRSSLPTPADQQRRGDARAARAGGARGARAPQAPRWA